MKQIQKFLFSIQLGSLLLAGFVVTAPAQAANCTYTISAAPDKTSIKPADTVTFSASVTRAGSLSDCTNSIQFELDMVAQNSTNRPSDLGPVGTQTASFNGNVAQTTIPFNAQAYTGATQMTFKVTAYNSVGLIGLTASSPINITISGGGTQSGSLSPQVYFNPQKASYGPTDGISVNVHVDSGNWNNLDPGITSLYYILTVNGTQVGTMTVDRSRAQSGDVYWDNSGQGIPISSANSFTNGSNTVKVAIWQAGTSLLLGEGTANLPAQGLANPGTNPGSTNPGTNAGTGNPGTNPGSTNPGTNPGSNTAGVQFTSPIKDTNLLELFLRMLKLLMATLGGLAVLMIIVGGFRMVLASGNEEAYSTAKKTITWAVLGLVVALLSFVIIVIVQNALGATLPNPSSFFQ